MSTRRHRELGVALIELVVSIVIISIAAASVLGLLSQTTAHSADSMVLSQAVSIAEAYLEEISLKSFADPDGIGEAGRANFDDVYDYNGLVDVGAADQFGNSIGALAAYTVTVAVTASDALPPVPATNAARIDVRVSFPPSVNLTLSGYKTRL